MATEDWLITYTKVWSYQNSKQVRSTNPNAANFFQIIQIIINSSLLKKIAPKRLDMSDSYYICQDQITIDLQQLQCISFCQNPKCQDITRMTKNVKSTSISNLLDKLVQYTSIPHALLHCQYITIKFNEPRPIHYCHRFLLASSKPIILHQCPK